MMLQEDSSKGMNLTLKHRLSMTNSRSPRIRFSVPVHHQARRQLAFLHLAIPCKSLSHISRISRITDVRNLIAFRFLYRALSSSFARVLPKTVRSRQFAPCDQITRSTFMDYRDVFFLDIFLSEQCTTYTMLVATLAVYLLGSLHEHH